MKEFYEPMLYLSTPDHPNTMGVLVTLKEAVDGDILRAVVEELRARFPYFYVRAVPIENDLFPIPNPLPMTVRNTWNPISLNSEESNDHIAAWKYEGKRLAFHLFPRHGIIIVEKGIKVRFGFGFRRRILQNIQPLFQHPTDGRCG